MITERADFKRHEFLGMNVFLLEMFRQFNEILGVRTTDYMSGSSTDLQDAIDNIAQQASQRTAKVRVSARPSGRREIEAEVAITNLAGHRFPSGVGFRRAFIELLVLEHRGRSGNGGLGFGSNQQPWRHRRRERQGPADGVLHRVHGPRRGAGSSISSRITR